MSADPGLIVRARGLATHLATRAALETLADAVDLPAFVRTLRHQGFEIDAGENPDIDAVDAAIGRAAARHVRVLSRWSRSGGHAPVLEVIDAEWERLALRALVRGAVQGAPAESRLSGLLPTRRLAWPLLSELAHASSALAVVLRLERRGHPEAARLLPIARQAHPDLIAADVILLRAFAMRAVAGAGRDSRLRALVQEQIDLGNVSTAMALAGQPREFPSRNAFVERGRWLSCETFEHATRATSAQAALDHFRRAARGTPLAEIVGPASAARADLHRAWLITRLARLARECRRDPLGWISMTRFILRLEAQSRDLRTLAWGAVLGTPAVMRRQQLVTP